MLLLSMASMGLHPELQLRTNCGCLCYMDLDWIVDVLVVWICRRGLENQQIRILQIFSKTLLAFTQKNLKLWTGEKEREIGARTRTKIRKRFLRKKPFTKGRHTVGLSTCFYTTGTIPVTFPPYQRPHFDHKPSRMP